MVDKPYKGIILYASAKTCDSEAKCQDIVDSYLKTGIFAKMSYFPNGDFYGYIVAAPADRLREHLLSIGYNNNKIDEMFIAGDFLEEF